MSTVRLTVAQATVRFLAHQHVERDGVRTPFFAGCLGIFGHGNVAGLGQALLENEIQALEGDGAQPHLPYVLGRNEQAMVHTAVAYARAKDRLQTWALTTSVGPGSTNLLTGAALATINRLPVLLLPADTFATRSAGALLQELERPDSGDVTVNDAFRPLSRYFDRVWRPEQLPAALLGAMRVLTDPVETGAATVCFPQDVQAEAHDFDEDLFVDRTWHVGRPPPERAALARAVEVVRSARRPLLVAGGGVHHSGAQAALAALAEATGIPVAQSQAGKGALPFDHPQSVGAIGSTGTTAANALARDADVVIGVGTRFQDFTTASRTAFADPGVRFVTLNVASFDALKHAAVPVVCDAREGLEALAEALAGWSVEQDLRTRTADLKAAWDATVAEVYDRGAADRGDLGARPDQNQVIGAVNELSDPRDVVVCAAGSMPGDLHKLWQVRDAKGYHVEYGYSCMGYEVAGGIGVAMAAASQDDPRDVFVMVGDGSYLMMATELVTAVQEGVKVVVVLVQNHGYASIGALSEQLGSQRFGTRYRARTASRRLDGDLLPVDLAANAESLGVRVVRTSTRKELEEAIVAAKAAPDATVIHVDTDPFVDAPSSESWWDVPVSEVSALASTQAARAVYEEQKARQRSFLRPSEDPVPDSSPDPAGPGTPDTGTPDTER
ncbi:3D-(3,5/4)-trihydroxycyclohexane-1,2-dione acylhydrolase (decyclizing) [Pseudokineococcus basanitobsidens]|uniref:3D-(3,5/4)-trihydroxycyclohexane-1,2-dione acylhydrolase (Decyclizing) n=1 Tax=Pseudokineococcus basanitobsidens TaxID=1926649 RepID=A0ABU8RFX7_9ACTN